MVTSPTPRRHPHGFHFGNQKLKVSEHQIFTTSLLESAIDLKPVRQSQNTSVKRRKRVKSNRDKIISV